MGYVALGAKQRGTRVVRGAFARRSGMLLLVAALGVGVAGCAETVSGTAAPVEDDTFVVPTTVPTTAPTTAPTTVPTTTQAPPPTTAGSAIPVETSPFDLEVGDCLADRLEGDSVSTVGVLPCEQEHAQEVYALELMDDGSFPGEDAVKTEASDVCRSAFEDFVDIDYDDSKYYFNTLYPTSDSWDQGDREIVCLAYDPDGPLTGSVEGAGI
jgi:hypothetical protein